MQRAYLHQGMSSKRENIIWVPYYEKGRKGNFVPVYVMRAYRGRRGTGPFVFNLGDIWR
jgi:hypothetical protein